MEAKESTNDMYASIDIVLGKLERQIRATKGVAQAKRRDGETVRKAAAKRAVPSDVEVEPAKRSKSAAKIVKKAAKRAVKAKR